MKLPRSPRSLRRGQRGVYFIVYAVVLVPMLAFIGLALDVSLMYVRKQEMQAVADSAALAAARALNGTRDGVNAAIANAASAGAANDYRFLRPLAVTWAPAALSFGTVPGGSAWTPAASVTDAELPGLLYARVDTAQLAATHRSVHILFMTLVGASPTQLVSARAVAGRRDSAIAPLAVCAMQPAERGFRSNPSTPPGTTAPELLEFGFRRGVSYNLLNLNPNSTATPVHYLVNPLDFPPLAANARHFTEPTVAPFVCTGSMPAPPLVNGTSMLYVQRTFPTTLIPELNARFNPTGSRCTPFTAPPDFNVFDFRGWWASPVQPGWPGSAASLASAGRLQTVADVDGGAATPSDYGPLWSFARPLRFDTSTGTVGAEFTSADLAKLYRLSGATWGVAPAKYTYGNGRSPYGANASAYSTVPTLTGEVNRRILNVPLLDCPLNEENVSPKRMLGIGRFFMTTRATASPVAVHAEFGGLVSYPQTAASVALFQ
jgi:Flp pilus assembly protein TadG